MGGGTPVAEVLSSSGTSLETLAPSGGVRSPRASETHHGVPFHEHWHSLSLALGAHGESDGECEGGEDHTQAVAGCGLDGLGGMGLNPCFHLAGGSVRISVSVGVVPAVISTGSTARLPAAKRRPAVIASRSRPMWCWRGWRRRWVWCPDCLVGAIGKSRCVEAAAFGTVGRQVRGRRVGRVSEEGLGGDQPGGVR